MCELYTPRRAWSCGFCATGRAACCFCRVFEVYRWVMTQNQGTRTLLLALLLVAGFELFRPAPAVTQPSMTSQMRDVIYELRGIKNELSSIERKMK